MSETDREELLSAYLDGEVTPEERAQVDAWLAESAELRQLRDDLLALRADLKTLPRYALNRDLTSTVVGAQAKPSNGTAADSAGSGTTVPGTLSQWWDRGSSTRRLLWPAIAIAAALLILVFDASRRDDEREVAQAPLKREAADLESRGEPKGNLESAPGKAEAAPQALGRSSLEAELADDRAAPPSGPAAGLSMRSSGDESLSAAKGDPGGSPVANAPAASGRVRAVAPSTEPTVPIKTFVCSVTPEYLQQKQFEKLLDANNVRWEQVPIPPQLQTEAASPAPAQTFKAEEKSRRQNRSQQSLYLLRASGDEVDKLLDQMPQAGGAVQQNRRQAVSVPQAQDTRPPQAGVQVMLVAPGEQPGAAAPAKAPTAK